MRCQQTRSSHRRGSCLGRMEETAGLEWLPSTPLPGLHLGLI